MAEIGPRMLPRNAAGESLDSAVPAAVGQTGKRSYADYFGGVGFGDPDMPKPGEPLWYRRRVDRKWIRAIVVDPALEGLDEPMGYRTVHIAVDLADMYQQTSPAGSPEGTPLAASPLGRRLNVTEGTEPGEWQREKPENADVVYEREQAQKASLVAMRSEMAKESGIMATSPKKLPPGVKP